MLIHRLFSSSIASGSSTPSRQAIRTATTWASASLPPSSSLSAKPQSQSQSTTSTPTNNNSRGRSKPYRTAVQVRPRPSTPSNPFNSAFFNSTQSDYSTLSPPPRKTQGRKRRASSFSRSPTSITSTNSDGRKSITHTLRQTNVECIYPMTKEYTFQPLTLNPHSLHLHMAFTPAHQPIMANLGVERFNRLPSKKALRKLAAVADSPFQTPSNPSPVRALTRKNREYSLPSGLPIISTTSTSLMDHLKVTSALSHPSLHHHLASPPSMSVDDSWQSLYRQMAESDVKQQIKAEWAFDSILARLGDKEAIRTQAVREGKVEVTQVSESEVEKKSLADALSGLDGVLAKLDIGEDVDIEGKGRSLGSSGVGTVGGATPRIAVEVKVIKIDGSAEDFDVGDISGLGEDLGVLLDSVKRKRKKKISKHKYQKRRKATRAQRKRLGK